MVFIFVWGGKKLKMQRNAPLNPQHTISPPDGTALVRPGCHMTAKEETQQEESFVCIKGLLISSQCGHNSTTHRENNAFLDDWNLHLMTTV